MVKGNAGNKVRTIVCQGCGTEVTRRMPPHRRYCSAECYRNSPKPQRKTGTMLSCEWCSASFYVPRSRIGARFCSNTCQASWQGRNKTEHNCLICGREFRWSPSRSKACNITYCSLSCRDADPERKVMLLRMNIRQQERRVTSCERAGYSILDALGVSYRRQATFASKFCVDALIPDALLIVQFDGDYWHDRKGVSGEPRILRRVALDHSQDAYIRTCGWRVVRFWESDLKRHPERCKEILIQHLSLLPGVPGERTSGLLPKDQVASVV